jgi:hypothetical protein
MDANILAKVRGTRHGLSPDGSDKRIEVTPEGLVVVAAGQLPGTEVTRFGTSWWAKNTTAAAALTAMPTTTSGLTIYNNSVAGSGLSFVIDSVAVAEIVVDATQQNQTALWVACGRNFTAPTAGTYAIGSFTGIKTYSGTAIVKEAATTVVADSPWMPVGNAAPLAAAVAGGTFKVTDVDLQGKFIVPAGGAFHLAASKLAATASQLFYCIRWHELAMQVA